MRKIQISKTNIGIAIGVVTLSVFTIITYLGVRRENKLIKQGVLTSGIIIGEAMTYRGYLELKYMFKVGSETYTNLGNNMDLVLVAGRDFQGKRFPVIYYPQHPEYNHILVSPVDFEKYNMKFPDSLNWVKDYLR